MIEGLKIEHVEDLHFIDSPEDIAEWEQANKDLDKITEELVVEILNGGNALFLGDGMTAKVYLPEKNKVICFKIICYLDQAGRNIPKDKLIRPTTNYLPNDQDNGYHLPEEEVKFMRYVYTKGSDVKVPRPFSFASFVRGNDGDTYMVKEHIHLIAMERMNAVSIKEVLENKKELPKSFNRQDFFKKLREFIVSMNEDTDVHHRDLHEGNVMIDIETGNPCVIDFGKATRGIGHDNPYREESSVGKTIVYTKDLDWVDKLESEMARFDSEKNG
jgi:serine/threonine protein kinase